jgi:hypothetical protein
MTTTYSALTGAYYDGVLIGASDDLFVGYGMYGLDSTFSDDNGGPQGVGQYFNMVAQGTGDIWGGQNVDGYGNGTDASTIMIAGSDKIQSSHHSQIYGDYTVQQDASAVSARGGRQVRQRRGRVRRAANARAGGLRCGGPGDRRCG